MEDLKYLLIPINPQLSPLLSNNPHKPLIAHVLTYWVLLFLIQNFITQLSTKGVSYCCDLPKYPTLKGFWKYLVHYEIPKFLVWPSRLPYLRMVEPCEYGPASLSQALDHSQEDWAWFKLAGPYSKVCTILEHGTVAGPYSKFDNF